MSTATVSSSILRDDDDDDEEEKDAFPLRTQKSSLPPLATESPAIGPVHGPSKSFSPRSTVSSGSGGIIVGHAHTQSANAAVGAQNPQSWASSSGSWPHQAYGRPTVSSATPSSSIRSAPSYHHRDISFSQPSMTKTHTPPPSISLTMPPPQSSSSASAAPSGSSSHRQQTFHMHTASGAEFELHDYDSSDNEEVFRKLTLASQETKGAGKTKFEVEKANRYGIKQKRIIVVDVNDGVLRFFTEKDICKTEMPFAEISKLQRKNTQLPQNSNTQSNITVSTAPVVSVGDIANDNRRLTLHFKTKRPYDLLFKNHGEACEFSETMAKLLELEIDHPTTTSQHLVLSRVISAAQDDHALPKRRGHPSPALATAIPLLQSASTSNLHGGSPPLNHHALHTSVGDESLNGASNEYLDYVVTKRNKYGLRQSRIIVLNSNHKSVLLLDQNRKLKKELGMKDILQVEIPRLKDPGKESEAQAFIVFKKDSQQRPFQLFFPDPFDRLHFCERLCSISPSIAIKDESDSVEDNIDCLRFSVIKVNKMGVKKKRVISLRSKERQIRSFNRFKTYKDVSFEQVAKVEKVIEDRIRIQIWFIGRNSPWMLLFPDCSSRERFMAQCQHIFGLIHEERKKIARERGRSAELPYFSTFENYFAQPTHTAALAPLTAPSPWAPIAATAPPPLPSSTAGLKSPSPALLENAASVHGRSPVYNQSDGGIRIFVGTWNQAGAPFTAESLTDFIPANRYDVYAIGLQECSPKVRVQWVHEIRAHVCQQSDKDTKEEDFRYFMLGPVKLWEIVLVVFVRKEHAAKLSNVEFGTIATGVGDVLGNKGAAALSFSFEESSLCFVVAHLAARSERLQQRAENYTKIIRQLRLGRKDWDVLHQYDHVIWFGDLNYRSELEFSECLTIIKMKDWKTLANADQLIKEMHKGSAFCGFKEGTLRFAPTYRWEKNEQMFSNKKFQSPSYTDRILWKSLPELNDFTLLEYTSAPNALGSDHRPVVAVFELKPRPYYTGRPPAIAFDALPPTTSSIHAHSNVHAQPLAGHGNGIGSTHTSSDDVMSTPPHLIGVRSKRGSGSSNDHSSSSSCASANANAPFSPTEPKSAKTSNALADFSRSPPPNAAPLGGAGIVNSTSGSLRLNPPSPTSTKSFGGRSPVTSHHSDSIPPFSPSVHNAPHNAHAPPAATHPAHSTTASISATASTLAIVDSQRRRAGSAPNPDSPPAAGAELPPPPPLSNPSTPPPPPPPVGDAHEDDPFFPPPPPPDQTRPSFVVPPPISTTSSVASSAAPSADLDSPPPPPPNGLPPPAWMPSASASASTSLSSDNSPSTNCSSPALPHTASSSLSSTPDIASKPPNSANSESDSDCVHAQTQPPPKPQSGSFTAATAASNSRSLDSSPVLGSPSTPPRPVPRPLASPQPPARHTWLIGLSKLFDVVIHDMRFISKSVEPTKEISATVFAPFCNQSHSSDHIFYNPKKNGWHWAKEIVLTPFVHDFFYLNSRHVFIQLNTTIGTLTKQQIAAMKMDGADFAVPYIGSTAVALRGVTNPRSQISREALAEIQRKRFASSGTASFSEDHATQTALREEEKGIKFQHIVLKDGHPVGAMEGILRIRYN